MINVYTCTDHDVHCHWPVGGASVIVAHDEEQARHLLDELLVANGLKPYSKEKYSLILLDLSKPNAVILNNGNY